MLGRHEKAYRHLMISQVETIIVGGGQAALATGSVMVTSWWSERPIPGPRLRSRSPLPIEPGYPAAIQAANRLDLAACWIGSSHHRFGSFSPAWPA